MGISKPDFSALHTWEGQVHKDTTWGDHWYSAALCIPQAYQGRKERSRSTAQYIGPSELPPGAEGGKGIYTASGSYKQGLLSPVDLV